MTTPITISARRMINIDVFLDDNDEIIGYQLGGITLKEFTTPPPYPDAPPEGTKTTLNTTVYGRLEYLLNTDTRETTVAKYEAYEDGLRTYIENKLKESENRGICISYESIDHAAEDGCNNCSYKTICP